MTRYENGYDGVTAKTKLKIGIAKQVIEDYKFIFADCGVDCCGERMMQEKLFKRAYNQILKLEL
jgi:hypothetical protein